MDNQTSSEPALLATIEDGHANNFDFLRFVLATLVVASHCYSLTSRNRTEFSHREPLLIATRGQMTGGDLAVNGFFIVSGFLITASRQNSRRAIDFLRKRVLRIYPGFLTAVLFGLLIVAPLGAPDLHAYLHNQSVLRDLLYMAQLFPPQTDNVFSNWSSHDQVNGSLWTIRYEFWCYLLIMGLGMVQLIQRRALMLALTTVVYGIYVYQLTFHLALLHGRSIEPFGIPNFYPRFLTYFFVGMVFFIYRDTIPRDHSVLALCVVLLLALAAMGSGFDACMPACGAYILFYIAFSRRLCMNSFARSGDLSYGIYLYAFPVQQLALYFIQKPSGSTIGPLMLFIVAYPITLLLAVMSWHLIEKPFLRMKPRNRTSPYIELQLDNSSAKPLN